MGSNHDHPLYSTPIC
uniref:Uncharacterized protein n=1 Tax=Anguilla anguilla TaxID=7936 RepID=A0A0E9UAJ0_ANGAN